MKKLRMVLVVLSALYVLVTIIFLLKDEWLFNQFPILNLIGYLQAWIVVGLILLTGVIVAGTLYIQQLRKQHRHLEKDYNAVKARLYDIEENRKAEVVRQKTEEEETERKLDAFNQSLKERNQPRPDADIEAKDPDDIRRDDRGGERPSSGGENIA